MEPYFKYIEDINFTPETRQKLADNIMSNHENYVRSGTKVDKFGFNGCNWFCPRELIPKDLMDEVGKRFKIPVAYEIIGQMPYIYTKIHVDGKVYGNPPRESLINFPIYPLNKDLTGPTNFFKLEDGTYKDYDNASFKLKAIVDYSLGLPFIFNLQEYHNAVNARNDYRFHCQFTTDIPFKDIVNIYNQGELFV
jgi:hypothetical protein|tara:strand:+ start:96 stop:677 length:582 start_codon:yes stop_codon:yes gene_type:complete